MHTVYISNAFDKFSFCSRFGMLLYDHEGIAVVAGALLPSLIVCTFLNCLQAAANA